MFDVRIPKGVEENAILFRMSPEIVAQSGQALKTEDQRPIRDNIKHYTVRYDQVLGARVGKKMIGFTIANDLDRFIAFYEDKDGKIHNRKDYLYINGMHCGEVTLSYEENGKRRYVRMRNLLDGYTRIEQILIGEEDNMQSLATRKYFDSLRMRRGYKTSAGSMKAEWPAHPSPHGVFTAYLPEDVSPYAPGKVDMIEDDHFERVGTRFYDPVWRQFLFYNIYSYKLPKDDVKYLDVELLLRDKHILRHTFGSVDNLEFKRLQNSMSVPLVETAYSIEPPEQYSYANVVRLKAQFFGDTVLVHEIMGPKHLVNSVFINNVMDSVEFHPSQAYLDYLEQNTPLPEEDSK
ncbi:MAG: hypothetical protein H6861_01730 [Rhodospirillales bacterium]|nr:hypothetical protein [Rhodospirillales bacterium]